MTLPGISILVHDLASNALGRALLLADLLREHTEVEILGSLGNSPDATVWSPASDASVKIHVGPPVCTTADLPAARRWLASTGRGDVLLVSKAMPTSLGLALDTDLGGRRLALDIDDWEYGLCLGHAPNRIHHTVALAIGPVLRHRPNHASRIRKLEARIGEIAHRLVSNQWLQSRFGGTLLYHVRDPDALHPDLVDRSDKRRELALDDRTWAGFIGTYRPHKGLEDLVEAMSRVRSTGSAGDARAPGLLLMGLDQKAPGVARFLQAAMARLGPDRLRTAPPFPISDLPAHVAAADLVVVPSRKGPATAGQIPAKLFDAMALARPIVATAVNDIPTILTGCGRVVTPGDVDGLAAAIESLVNDPALARRLGTAARQRLLDRYSYDAGRQVLSEFVAGLTMEQAL